jgi:magnesium transporter
MDATTDDRRSPSEPDPGGEAAGAAAQPPPANGSARLFCWTPSGIVQSDDLGALPAMVGRSDSRVWIDLTDPSPATVRDVAATLGLHPLVADDIEERNERAKVAVYDDVVHIVLFDLEYHGEVQPAELDLVLGTRFLLSVHDSDLDLAKRVPMRDGVSPVLGKGTDFLLYTIIDRIIDGYFPMMDKLADEIDDLQDLVIESPDEDTLQKVFVLKRELLGIRRATSPAREVLNQLTNRELAVIDPDHLVYFRDVYDHLIRVTDELDNYRDLAAATLDIYLSTVNNNLSRIMKRLTGVTVILAGIGAVAGVFGMSEAGALIGGGEPTGFWVTTSVIMLAALVAALILRRIDWI